LEVFYGIVLNNSIFFHVFNKENFMNAKIIGVLIITGFLFLSACKGMSKKERTLITIGATLVGVTLLYDYMTQTDRNTMQSVLENSPTSQPVHWTNPGSGIPYTMTVTNTSNTSGGPCREFQTVGLINGQRETLTGTACRQRNGYWKMQ